MTEYHRFIYLDVLKAIAIIAVVLFHLGVLPYGYLGVDVFLVIGGFLITRSIQKRSVNKDGWSFDFIIDRICRLLPVLLVAGIAAMAAGWFTMLPDDYENLSQSVVATNCFANNILSAITTGDYWDIANEYKPLMHTWYLGVLMQCCIFYTLLFLIAGLNRGNPNKTRLILISSLVFVSLLCYFGCLNEAHRFYYLPSRFFEFGIGGIIALIYHPRQDRPLPPIFSFICYGVLLVLITVSFKLFPDNVRLVIVTALTSVLVLSAHSLNNKVTSNAFLAKIGIASFSIYVWHQIIIAFWRYVYGNQLSMWQYLLLLAIVGLISWVSYRLIEKRTSFSGKHRRQYVAIAAIWLALTLFAGYIYWNAGVVRDIPELAISKQERHRRMHAEYTERGLQYNKPFASSDKAHWLVIGNSFGRDFVNIILESKITDNVEVSYFDEIFDHQCQDRFANADKVFVSTRGISRQFVSAVEVSCWVNGLTPDKVIVVGDKSFGENNGHVYAKRRCPDYFEQTVEPLGGQAFLKRNCRLHEWYGERFLDLMSFVIKDGRVRVFTPDHRFISADGKHLTAAGARFFSEKIDWSKYLK